MKKNLWINQKELSRAFPPYGYHRLYGTAYVKGNEIYVIMETIKAKKFQYWFLD